jgi:hypothetical protein
MTANLFAEMVKFLIRPDVDAIVWIFLNHAEDIALSFPNDKQMEDDEVAELGRHSKPIVVVMDCCSSTDLAEQVLLHLAPEHPIAFLTAARTQSLTSAVVLSKDDTLVEHSIDDLHYFVSSSLFTRSLFQLIFYSDVEGMISEIPGWMNIGRRNRYRGFHARLQTKCPEMENLDFRLLFGGPVAENTPVSGSPSTFSELIPRRPVAGFLDDLTQLCGRKGNLQYRYIQVEWDREGTVVRCGSGILDESDPHQSAIRNQPRSKPVTELPVHILVGGITDFIIEDLKKRGYRPTDFPPELLISTLRHFMRNLNQITARETVDLVDLAGYVVDQDIEWVFELIENARYAIAAKQGIQLEAPQAIPLTAQRLDMKKIVDETANRLSRSMSDPSPDLTEALVVDFRWANANLRDDDLRELLSRISRDVTPRFREAPVRIQVGICQLIGDHRDLVPNDEVVGHIFDLILSFPSPESLDHSVNFGLAEASLYGLLKLCQRFPVTGSKVIGSKLIETGNIGEYKEEDMGVRSTAFMARLEVIEEQVPAFLSKCAERLKVASALRSTNAEMVEEGEETRP